MAHSFLTRTSTLWRLFWALILLSLAFGVVMYVWDFEIIDEMSNEAAIKAHLAAMSQTQKNVHAIATATLDLAYPFVYGGLFAGMALRFLGPVGKIAALPSFVVIPVDLAEGVVQVFALTGQEQYLWLKAYLTPLKLGLFFTGMALAFVALLIALRQRFKNRQSK